MTTTVTAPVAAEEAPAPWVPCPGCGNLIYRKRLAKTMFVCPECGDHHRVGIDQRLQWLLDGGALEPIAPGLRPVDSLGFVDKVPYRDRLLSHECRTGRADCVIAGHASIEGNPVVVAAFDFAFMGGSLGAVAGELITRAAETATELRVPLLLVTTSGGARMQEGCMSLMQLAKTADAIGRLQERGVLCINLNVGPTFGGATASFATLGDVILTEPGALTGFAGPRVIEQTIRKPLPAGFQTAAFQVDHGMADHVVPREKQRDVISRLLQSHATQGSTPPVAQAPVTVQPDDLANLAVPELLTLARHTGRPTVVDYVEGVFDGFIELRGDRLTGDDPAVFGGLARLGGQSVVVVGHRKAHATRELVAVNFGMPLPSGFHKALRLYAYAARFGFPVVTFVDTPGAYPGTEAEERGQGHVIAQCILAMSRLPVATVSVITGEGGSGGALAMGVGNTVLMMQNAYYSVISPEGCSSILWNDATHAATAAEALGVRSSDLLRRGIVDGVILEPENGAHTEPADAVDRVRRSVVQALGRLKGLTPSEIIEHRHRRFRSFGDYTEAGEHVMLGSAPTFGTIATTYTGGPHVS